MKNVKIPRAKRVPEYKLASGAVASRIDSG
jgi:hypothetical protein